MSKASQAGNSVVTAIEQTCALFRMPCFREQSRVLMVEDRKKGSRPMTFGRWTDDDGVKHSSGKADLLLHPQITISIYAGAPYFSYQIKEKLAGLFKAGIEEMGTQRPVAFLFTVPLWVECKAGEGRQTDDQKLFQSYVESKRAFYLLCRDSADPLLAWLKKYGVQKYESPMQHAR